MSVPRDCFGGKSAEGKASEALITLFTFVAVRVILEQFASYDNEGGTLSNPDAQRLTDFLNRVPMKDGNKWVQEMMTDEEDPQLRLLAVRILEVRTAYIEQFDFAELEAITRDNLKTETGALINSYLQGSINNMGTSED